MYDHRSEASPREGTIEGEGRHRLISLGDLMELLVEGWRIDALHYADCSAPGGTSGPPAAFFRLVREAAEELSVYVPDDGRALSHRALVGLFRERPEVWKHRTPAAIPWADAPDDLPPPEPGDVADEASEPEGLVLAPATLRRVLAVNQIQSVDGLTIALVSLEHHADGARLRYMAHASDARTRRQMRVLDVVAVDDAGRRYRVASTDARDEGNRMEGCLVLVPAVPRERRRLTVTVGTVSDALDGAGPADPERSTSGPWVFPIPLAPGPGGAVADTGPSPA